MLSVESRVWAVHGFHALRDPACVFWGLSWPKPHLAGLGL